jgi:hypothetical protein
MIQTTSPSANAVLSRLRPRSVGEILDQAFRVYRKHFLTFLAIIAVVHVPLQLVIQALILSMLGPANDLTDLSTAPSPAQTANETVLTLGLSYAAILLLSVLYWLLQYLSQGALTAAIMDSYLDRPVSFGSAYRATFQRIGPLLGSLGLQLLILIGIFVPVLLVFGAAVGAASGGTERDAAIGIMCCGFLLIIPAGVLAAYVFVRYTAAVPSIMAENLGPVESLRRSWRLIQNYWWRTAGLWALLGVLSSIISAGPGYFALLVVLLFARSLDEVTMSAIVSGVSIITTMFFIPVQLASLTLYYFDIRTRREGFDLETAIAQRYGYDGAHGAPAVAQSEDANLEAEPTIDLMTPPVLGKATEHSTGEAVESEAEGASEGPRQEGESSIGRP